MLYICGLLHTHTHIHRNLRYFSIKNNECLFHIKHNSNREKQNNIFTLHFTIKLFFLFFIFLYNIYLRYFQHQKSYIDVYIIK